jgi:hypothetical protein
VTHGPRHSPTLWVHQARNLQVAGRACYQLIGNWTGLEVLPIMARTRSLETEDA